MTDAVTCVGGTWDGMRVDWFGPHLRLPRRAPWHTIDLRPERVDLSEYVMIETEDYVATKLSDGSRVYVEQQRYNEILRLHSDAQVKRAGARKLARQADELGSAMLAEAARHALNGAEIDERQIARLLCVNVEAR